MDEGNQPRQPREGGLEARVLRLEDEVERLQAEVMRLRGSSVPGAAVWRHAAEEQEDRSGALPPPLVIPTAMSTEAPGDEVGIRAAEPAPPMPVASGGEGMGLPKGRRWGGHPGGDLSFENRLGSQWFNRIGIVLLLLGTSWFLKLAVDRGWIVPSPTARVIAGLVAGAGLVLWSEHFRRKGLAAFSYSLKALGSGVLYLTLWAGFRLYGLLPAALALALMIGVTGWNAFMAWAQDAQLLAGYALAGGLATPVLLSTGGNHEVFLFTYLLAMDLATVALVRLRRWPRLLVGAFPATVVYFIGWYVEYWAAGELAVTSVFIALFGIAFGSVAVGVVRSEAGEGSAGARARGTLLVEVLGPLVNAAFLGLAFYSVLQDSGHHGWLPWMVLALAAVYLGVMRLPQSRTVSAIHLSIAVVFLTIAIPLKASGHWITAGWLVEGLALVWVSARLTGGDESYAAGVLRWLGTAALGLGFFGVAFHLLPENAASGLWTSDTATALLGVGVFAGAAWVAAGQAARPGWRDALMGSLLAVDGIAVLLSLREVLFSWSSGAAHTTLRSAAFGSAVLGLVVLAAVAAVCVRRMGEVATDPFWGVAAAVSIVLFNLTAVLTGVREIESLWNGQGAVDADAALKQGLAISAYLMVYGAGLLAAGFWRRSAFLRWQGLALLLFTILKTFLWDMRNLSQGYRVASFLALGALLMAISYAYQRDWLALRGGNAEAEASDRTQGSGVLR